MVVMTAQFKAQLKKIIEKLKLLSARYGCERFSLNYPPSSAVKIKYEDKLGKHDQYGYKAYMKMKTENDAVLRVIRHLEKYYNVVMKDVNERELYMNLSVSLTILEMQ